MPPRSHLLPYEKRSAGRPKGKSPKSDGHNPNPLWQDYIETGKASDALVAYRQDKKPEADVTDSGHVMALVMHLAGIGWEREKVVAVLTDPATGISTIINAKGIAWLDRTLEKVTWKTAHRASGSAISSTWRGSSRIASIPDLIYYRSEFWSYSWGIYHALDKVTVEASWRCGSKPVRRSIQKPNAMRRSHRTSSSFARSWPC